MADWHRTRSKAKPPPYIEGYLTAKHSSSASFRIKARKYYCVVFGNLIQCFRDEKSYTEKRENVKAQIDLDLVRTITETVSMPASRQKQEYCFKLVFNDDNEIDFIAQSKQDVKNWVECLTQTHKFWEAQKHNEQFEIINKDEYDMNGAETNQETAVDVTDEERDPRLIKVSIIMSHGHPYTAYVPPDGNTEDLWATALKSLPGHFCFKCITCQLRRSTMELWSVSKDGVPYKIEEHFNASEYCNTAASPVYLLEHNFKLLVVFFEDSSYLVSPVDISTKARDIPDIEIFSRKLAEIDCSNVQLYLKTASGTATPFSQEDAPLRTLWELHGDKWALKPREGEKFLLKSKAILRNNPENLAEKIQQGKLKTKICERKQKKALKRIEYHDCKGKVMKILELPKTTKPLPFDVSLTSGPDMMEDYFSSESKKSKHPIQHCTFLPSPEKTTPTQKNAPFCPPDSLDFTPKQISHEEVTVRRQRSMTDVTSYRTECKTEVHRRVSDSGSLTRKGAIRRKSSYVSLEKLIKKDKQGEINQSRDLSFDSDQENFSLEKSADIDLHKAQDVSEVTSFSSGDMQMSRKQSDDPISVADKIREDLADLNDNENLGETNASLLSSGYVVGDDELETELDIEKDVHCDSGIDSFDGSMKNEVGQSDCFDGKEEQPLHSCEYYDVKSPYFLKNILHQYSRLNADEEEVGADHPPRGICLSSIHLLHNDGRWAVENDGELDEDNEEDLEHKEGYEMLKLPGDIEVFFNLNNRTWVVKIIKVENVTTIDEKLPNQNESETANENSCSIEEDDDQLSNGDASSDSSTNENPCSLEEEEDFRCATWKSRYHPLTINHCGQNFRPLDDSYELEHEEPITTQDFTEVKILEDTIQKLFYHMEKYRNLTALECLDDVKCPDVRELVCVELCSALERIVSNGLKKKFTLLSAIRYTIWDVVKGTSTDNVSSAVVRKINSVGALDDKIRFELFVCECLNHGALASWVETLQNDKKKLHTFYDEKALVMKLPKDTLERLVSRITFLPFNISFLQYVQKKMKETRDVTQFAFE